MSSRVRQGRGFVAVLGLGLLLAAPLLAQDATDPPTYRVHTQAPPPLPVSLTMSSLPPGGKSPVALFRELLDMNFMQRVQALTNRTPEARKQILAKLREYDTFKPDERKLRLQVTELRWYLYPLMRAPATHRAELLARVPEPDRRLVEDRLGEWDKLSAQAQKDLLQNEAVIRCLSEVSAGTNQPSVPRLLLKKVQEWQALPEAERQNLLARFDQFFRLTGTEKQKVLHTLSNAERQQIEKTLGKFTLLSPVQRAHCMRSFEKFTELSPAEREQFLKNAERWTLMTPEERQKWRDLVNLAPTLPSTADIWAKLRRHALPVQPRDPPLATNGG